jgi:hypothetical protein
VDIAYAISLGARFALDWLEELILMVGTNSFPMKITPEATTGPIAYIFGAAIRINI